MKLRDDAVRLGYQSLAVCYSFWAIRIAMQLVNGYEPKNG